MTVDELGVTRQLGSSTESVTWFDLALVEIRTTSDEPFAEDMFWMLHGRSGTGVVVPSSTAPDELLVRLQALPGFSNEVLIESMASTADATFECWRRGRLKCCDLTRTATSSA
ncbi:hypothetical protein ABIE44_001027 [Marmoricola sp. OAE513]|uniref:hypothetical protein n=1 Tax=Marmoricola sp. OAE513 TaxID=2817894 RepID=UPI001AE643B1